jgi:hypothetical protein
MIKVVKMRGLWLVLEEGVIISAGLSKSVAIDNITKRLPKHVIQQLRSN